MSKENLYIPVRATKLTIANLTDGILSMFNGLTDVVELGPNLILDSNNFDTVQAIDQNAYPTFGVIQNSNIPGFDNNAFGTNALNEIDCESYGNVATGSHTLAQMWRGVLNTASGYYAGASTYGNGEMKYSGSSNTFYGALAGITYFCDFDPEEIAPFYGGYSTYIGAMAHPSNDSVVFEQAFGVMLRGAGQSTTSIGNGVWDKGLIYTNAGLERYTFVGTYHPPNGNYSPYVPMWPTFSMGNIDFNSGDRTFRFQQIGIYRFTLKVSSTAATAYVWRVMRATASGGTINDTVLTLTTDAIGTYVETVELYAVYDIAELYFISADYVDDSSVTCNVKLLVEFVSRPSSD
jgi:hypothetical protein